MSGDMFAVECEFCPRRFFSSVVYKDHMRLEHPFKKLQRVEMKPANYSSKYKKKTLGKFTVI